jgi:hypothetical protein
MSLVLILAMSVPVIRYQGIDWRDRKSWACDGISQDAAAQDLSLDEALFIRTKDGKLQASAALAQAASNFEHWLEEQVSTT